MELRHLRYFVAVAEELNFRRAAERLHISQPSLSHQVMALERELGTPLLERDSKGVQLTSAGRVFLVEARRTLDQADRARSIGRRAAEGDAGALRIGYPPFGAPAIVHRILQAYADAHPDVEVALTSAWAEVLIDALRQRELDVAFFRLPTEFPDELEVQVIGRDPLVAAIPAGHALASRERIALSELNGERFVVIKRALNPVMYDLFMTKVFPSAGVRFSEVRHELSLEDVFAAVSTGWGIGVMISDLVDVYRPADVVYVPFDEPAPYLESAAAWVWSGLSGMIQALLDVIDKVVRNDGTNADWSTDTSVD